MCGETGQWGECIGDQVTTKYSASGGLQKMQVLGGPVSCDNDCDPFCKQMVDNTIGFVTADLPGKLCAVGGGLSICAGCGYGGPHSDTAYSSLPSAWQELAASCTTDDQCGYDTLCALGTCKPWKYPCHGDETSCSGADLVAGPACAATGSAYHIPVCNRGSVTADTGTLSLGLYSGANLQDCVSPAYAAPDSGLIQFSLGTATGQFIEPGKCIDVNPGNSSAVGLDLAAMRAVVVNSDAAVGECNLCNNWNVLDPSATCVACVNLQCSQTCATTTLTGTIYDPAGVNPLPGVAVYVPNGPLAPFDDGVACDTCASLFSGSPIASALTNFDGTFTLSNVPAEVGFPLVMQIGRWRRQVSVPAIPGCGSAVLSPANSHLPTTQKRCVGSTCTGEGDIPKIAIVMGDADPIQCLFRKIGIDDSEFTGSEADGRVHLYNHNGMRYPGSHSGFTGSNPLFSDAARLDDYNAVFSACDYSHNTIDDGDSYSGSVKRSGPSYNSPPDPTATPSQRANVRNYVNRGGRLFATHWLSEDFVHLAYNPPASVFPILSPYDPSTTFQSQLATLAGSNPGLAWSYVDPATFNPAAPAAHLFGRNLETAGNTTDPSAPAFAPVWPAFKYTIDTSTPLGQTFSQWASVVGASPDGDGTVTFNSWAHLVRDVRPPAIRLAYGDSTDATSFVYPGTAPANVPRPQQACLVGSNNNGVGCTAGGSKTWGGPHVALFQFDTPWGSPPENQCGRVVVAQSHVTRHNCKMPSANPPQRCSNMPPYDTGNLPPDCACMNLPDDWDRGCGPSTTLLPQEKAFEFMIFSTTQCVGTVAPPPPSVSLPEETFTRDYEADCAEGEKVVWRFFSWQAVIPTGTSIRFDAQTAPTVAELAASNPVTIGNATASTVTWTSEPETVEELLQLATPPQSSRNVLRVRIALLPNGSVSPTLTNWQQAYNCMPAE